MHPINTAFSGAGSSGAASAGAVSSAAVSSAAIQDRSPREVRLVKAAHEFEAQMMKELMKPMIAGDPLTGDSETSESGSGGALGEFASEALGRALSEHGGFGIANKIVHELSPSGNKYASNGVTGNEHANTG